MASGGVDILGVSATFGQHDLMTRLLDAVTSGDTPPLVVAGGSLTARNERILLERYPNLLIGRSAGEPTVFQGRTDLLLRAVSELGVDEIVDGVHDEEWVAEHTTGRPFYTGISYMLVSMECLIGAAYTRTVEAAGLIRRADPSMGRVEAEYADWRIGLFSRWAQLWIDRNFALDYTLKSLEKILDGQPCQVVRGVRRILKDAAYRLFGGMLGLSGQTDTLTGNQEEIAERCAALAEALIGELHAELAPAIAEVGGSLPANHYQLLRREYTRWAGMNAWQLINANDPCGT